jgi:hypothetical protein
MKRALVFLVLLPLVSAQIAVEPASLPLAEIAKAVVKNPALAERLIPQIMDAFIEDPQGVVSLGLALMSDSGFLESILVALPSLMTSLPYIFSRLPEIASSLPVILEAFLPEADRIINSFLLVVNENPDLMAGVINSFLAIAVDNLDVLSQSLALMISPMIEYSPQLLGVLVKAAPLIPEIVSGVDLRELSVLLLSKMPEITDMLTSLLSGLSDEQIAEMSGFILSLIAAFLSPRVLPSLISAVFILLFSPQSLFSLLYGLISSLSLETVLTLLSSLFDVTKALMRTIRVLLSSENIRIAAETMGAAMEAFSWNEVQSVFRESHVVINGTFVPRWVIS